MVPVPLPGMSPVHTSLTHSALSVLNQAVFPPSQVIRPDQFVALLDCVLPSGEHPEPQMR